MEYLSANPTKILTLVFILTISTSLYSFAQAPRTTIDCSTDARIFRPKNHKIISFGVINGKAVDLVKPEYPPAARSVGVRGSVKVQVLIDPRGCVNETKVIFGHPLLRSSSNEAAKKSTFSPQRLSGNPVWVYGIIVYNYLPERMNWLELGYSFDVPERLIEYLPPEFESQRSQLKSMRALPYLDQNETTTQIVDSIRTELNLLPTEQWFFSVGMKLKLILYHQWVGADERQKILAELKYLIEISPTGVSSHFVSKLRGLISETDSSRFYEKLKAIESVLYGLGN